MLPSRSKTLVLFIIFYLASVHGTDPDQFENFVVSYITVAPLGKPQRVIAINGQFPGPPIKTTTNNNLHINVTNLLDEPLLITWNGIQQRRTSWQDGVAGTNCPILPNQSWQYNFQVKDQIGTYFYYPSLNYQRAAGGYGGLQIANRIVIKVPFPEPADDYTLLIGDWYLRDFKTSRSLLDQGRGVGRPNGVLINGKGPYAPGSTDFAKLNVEPGKTYRLRITNVGTAQSLNFRIEGHLLLLVETEGSYTNQTEYDSLDIHLGQSYSVLVTANQAARGYYIVASTKFNSRVLNGVGVLQYTTSTQLPTGPLPAGPAPTDLNWSLTNARSIRWNLTAGAARPNPQGSFKYGKINITRTIQLASSAVLLKNTKHYAVNGISYITPDTPLKLADFFKIPGVFTLGSIPDAPDSQPARFGTSVLALEYKGFIEVIFINTENEVQSWHVDGYNFFVVGYGVNEQWSSNSRLGYNLIDAVSRNTVQVYPKGWSAVLISLDNVGMWQIRSQSPQREYLGQQLYFRVFDNPPNTRTEAPIPSNVLLCGQAVGKAR